MFKKRGISSSLILLSMLIFVVLMPFAQSAIKGVPGSRIPKYLHPKDFIGDFYDEAIMSITPNDSPSADCNPGL